jgi:hypothetical protein
MTRRRVLLLLLDNWHGVARLPAALRDADFEVGLASESHFFAAKSRFVDRHYPLSMRAIRMGKLQRVWDAITDFAPDFVIPADEHAVRFVQFVLAEGERFRLPSAVRRVLQRSVGHVPAPNPIGRRWRMLELAGALGFDIPVHAIAPGLVDAAEFAERHGWPVYLKRDHSSGGYWVRRADTGAELADAYFYLTGGNRPILSTEGMAGLPKRLLKTYVFRNSPITLPKSEMTITVEAMVAGEPAYHTAVAVDGQYLTGISAEVDDFYPKPTGPSTRVRLHGDREMERIASALVKALGFTGFFGLDFIRRPDGGLTFLEFNARPTPVAHLGGLIGADLCQALHGALDGAPPPPVPSTAQVSVALFPQDWRRTEGTPDRSGFLLDIPRGDPSLLEAFSPVLPAGWDRPASQTCSGVGV